MCMSNVVRVTFSKNYDEMVAIFQQYLLGEIVEYIPPYTNTVTLNSKIEFEVINPMTKLNCLV